MKEDCITRLDPEWLEKSSQWQEAKQELQKWKEAEETLRQELIELACDENCAGGGVELRKLTRKGLVDYSQIPELRDVDLETYRKPPVTSWRIRTTP